MTTRPRASETVTVARVSSPKRIATFASEWFADREHLGLRQRTLEHTKWTLVDRLLPHFRAFELSAITSEEVDRYVRLKAREGRLGAASINRTVTTLAAVLEVAVEYGHLDRNPAKGKRLKLPTTKPTRPFLEPEQVRALLAAAGELDAEDGARRPIRRPLLATLAYAGVRVGELLALKWADVDLATGRIRVRASKTDAGVRTVDVQPELRSELVAWKLATRHAEPEALVFGTATGRPDARNNVRRRIVLRAVARANERIARDGGCDPLPEGLSLHALRRTFASWLGHRARCAVRQRMTGRQPAGRVRRGWSSGGASVA